MSLLKIPGDNLREIMRLLPTLCLRCLAETNKEMSKSIIKDEIETRRTEKKWYDKYEKNKLEPKAKEQAIIELKEYTKAKNEKNEHVSQFEMAYVFHIAKEKTLEIIQYEYYIKNEKKFGINWSWGVSTYNIQSKENTIMFCPPYYCGSKLKGARVAPNLLGPLSFTEEKEKFEKYRIG